MVSLPAGGVGRPNIERPEDDSVWIDTGSVLSHSERFLCSDPYRATHETRNLVYGHLCTLHTRGFVLTGRMLKESSLCSCHHRSSGTKDLTTGDKRDACQSPTSLTLAMALAMLARSLMSNHTGSSLSTI